MGVYKLWELLLTIAQPMSIDKMGGKVLAIDASIWIVKIDSLYASNAQKLKSMLSKIMLLKRNNILPVFVFDGPAPVLKRRTLEERYRRRLVAGQQEAKKKSELQVMRLVEGSQSNTRMSERSKRMQKNEQDLTELNKTLTILSEFQEKADKEVNNELLEKIALQSEILNKKYQIMLELTPALADYKYFVTPEEYAGLDLQQKMQYLDQLEQHKWRAIKAQRKSTATLTQQEKLMHDLQAIEKRSIVREMQDNLFRKMMQKNVTIQNGYEIVETIYNGRKVIQKRKVKEQGNNFGFNMRKGKMKNNPSCINFQHQNLSEDEQNDDFLAEFCSNTVSTKPNASITASQQPAIDFNKRKKGAKKREKTNVQRKNDESDDSAVYLPFQSYKTERMRQQDEQPERYVNKQELNESFKHQDEGDEFQDRDCLPVYIPNQSLLYINYSNDNLQLQNLLKVLGIPFLVAPSEAEAQCAALQQMGIVDGVVTEDSDAFLFGAKQVFRGVFQDNVRLYDYRNIQQRLRMNRQKLIIFALLLGSDYTPGVKGVGLVNAMEILKVFPTFSRLETFKKWARLPDILLPDSQTTQQLLKNATPQQVEFYQLHRKFKNHWYVDEQFGSKRVEDAYMKPEVIQRDRILSLQKQGAFGMQPCNKALLEKLLKEKLDLEQKQMDHFMKLLTFECKVKRENKLENYFSKLNEGNQLAKIRSKRLERSLQHNQ